MVKINRVHRARAGAKGESVSRVTEAQEFTVQDVRDCDKKNMPPPVSSPAGGEDKWLRLIESTGLELVRKSFTLFASLLRGEDKRRREKGYKRDI